LLKVILQELSDFHWESYKKNPIGAAARNKSRLAPLIFKGTWTDARARRCGSCEAANIDE
jgi:hypothetical protein